MEGSDTYQLLLVPWKNVPVVPSRNYRRPKSKNLSSPTFFEQSPSNFQHMFLGSVRREIYSQNFEIGLQRFLIRF